MWEQFLPPSERHKYYSQIMEGSGGGGGPLEPHVIGWLWGFLFGTVATAVVAGLMWILL